MVYRLSTGPHRVYRACEVFCVNIYNQKFLFNYLVMWLYCFPFVSLIWYVIDIYPTCMKNLF